MTPLQLLASAPSTSGGMGWNYSVVAASNHPDHPAEMRQQNTGHRHLDDHRPASQGQPAAAHRPTQARQPPRRRTCNRRTPRPPNGVEQQPGRSPVPTARLAPRAVERGVYHLQAYGNTPPSKPTQRTSALPRSSGMEGLPPMSRGRRGAIACGPLNAEWDLGSPARLRPRAPIGRDSGNSAAE